VLFAGWSRQERIIGPPRPSARFDSARFRSKNLDILFKRDYYEQRLALQRLASEQEKEAAALEEEEEEEGEEEAGEVEGEMGSTVGMGPGDRAVLRSTRSFDQMDPR
jgi:hypothetical protein